MLRNSGGTIYSSINPHSPSFKFDLIIAASLIMNGQLVLTDLIALMFRSRGWMEKQEEKRKLLKIIFMQDQ